MVRNVQKKDLERISEIIIFGKRAAYRSIFHNDIASFNEMTVVNLYQEYLDFPSTWKNMLVYDDGIVKGVINKIAGKNNSEIELCDFYVDPFFKGQGVGRALMAVFLKKATEKHIKKISLWVIKDNLHARRFYELNGFIPGGKEQLIYGTDIVDMLYVRDI